MTWDHPVDILVTFDHDAESAFLQHENGVHRGPSYLSHGAFGAKVGMGRVLEVLDARGIPATFFVPGWVAERWPDSVRTPAQHGHEIALHGYLHEYPTAMVDAAEERMVLSRGLDALTAVAGTGIVGYRPPGSMYSNATVELLREFGFRYGSAMQDDDGPYLHPTASGRPLVEIPCHWQLCDDLFGWHSDVRMTPSQVEETWTTELEALGRYPERAYVLTLHPHQIAHPGRLAMLDRVLDRAIELGGRFRTCADMATETLDRMGR
ncbi:polysaccharide deacetylase family protein [Amycolatopsis sp. GM8]|uniref:polysaccharide deacetylase family protein n=1 Tax=Amycolatopsis sp. GM8 TaxID=2896530 RepID=UPI001F000CC1|nr:polysaccharide deacetylase family protein [Amycolatopsis sp. GM8]